MTLQPGDKLGRYRIEGPLGQGGMGVVFRGRDEELGRDVAIKLIRADADEGARARFKREARAACSLLHPNVAAVFDVGESEGTPYLVMELVEGQPLRALIGDETVGFDKRVRWLGEVANALEAAHERGLVHRDVKPENVLIRADGVAKILDFGIARSVVHVDPTGPTARPEDATLTADGVAIGTPAYMSPEQLSAGAVDARSDQFSWAVMAFELLTGELPWESSGSAYAVAAAILNLPPRLEGTTLSVEVVRVIERCLAKKKEDRFSSIREASEALNAAQREVPQYPGSRSSESVQTPAPAMSDQVVVDQAVTSLPKRRGPRTWLYALLALVALFAILARKSLRGLIQGPAKGTTSASAAPATSSVTDDPPLRFATTCPEGGPESKRCTDGVAWCDDKEVFMGCCTQGLALNRRGRCECPPGGTTVAELVDQGCQKGDRNPSEIQKVVRKSFRPIRDCYEHALGNNPKLRGLLSMHFTLTPEGRAVHVSLAGAAVPDPAFQDCVLAVFQGMKFPPPADGYGEVIYPIPFTADE